LNNKIIIFSIVIILFASTFPSVCSINRSNIQTYIDEENFDYDLEENFGNNKSDDNNDFQRYPVMIDIPDPFDPNNASPKPTIIETPAYFSWKDYNGEDWTTPAKNQGYCGSCWAFAALGVLESMINIREGYADLDPDLSEQYILSCLPSAGSCRGGSITGSFYYMMDTSASGNFHNGIIPESCFPYMGIDANGCDYGDCNNDPVECSDKSEDWLDYLIPVNDFEYWDSDGSSQDILRIKTQIMQDGPVATLMLADDDFHTWIAQHHNPDDYYPYTGPVLSTNHVIVILGWNDDPDIGNGGYWICKNSWGTYSGYEGFFNIEYGSLNMNEKVIVSVDYDPESYDWPPVADTNGPYSGEVGQEIYFDASGSVDPEGDLVNYYWDFGDGTNSTGLTVSHEYSQRGIFPITLMVTDEVGQQDIDESFVCVDLWMLGNSWTYKFDDINFNFDQDGTTFSFQGGLEELTLTVTDVTNENYQVDINGILEGELEAVFNDLTISGTISKTSKNFY